MKKEKELLVAVASQKGGVGKSVFTVLLASVLHYRKDVRVAVVGCDSPQHSIALMRERDMENVMKNAMQVFLPVDGRLHGAIFPGGTYNVFSEPDASLRGADVPCPQARALPVRVHPAKTNPLFYVLSCHGGRAFMTGPGRDSSRIMSVGSEERRVGKECRCRWSPSR